MGREWRCYPNNCNTNTRNFIMPLVAPFHSTKPWFDQGILAGLGRQVYHNNSLCTEGNNIERHYLAAGHAGRPLCEHCARLNAQGR
jgi:hypothetical protein